MSHPEPPVDYADYLQLSKILDAQKPASIEAGSPAHDEMLFIVIHQVYELWFRQVLWELSSIIEMFDAEHVDETNIGIAVQRMQRSNEIMKLMIDQIQILETMTPLDFLEFRGLLGSASGFQSKQFRELEQRIGVGDTKPNLFRVLESWLERTPFIALDEFNFGSEYIDSLHALWKRERETISKNPHLSLEQKQQRFRMMDSQSEGFLAVIDPEKHHLLVVQNQWRLSYKATMAALFISLYRDEPILHLPFRLLFSVVELDENFNLWRHRHSLMVLRMIGTKVGTGGSSGHDYLRSTVEGTKVFQDLFNISSLLIPRSELPILPQSVKDRLGFHHTAISRKE